MFSTDMPYSLVLATLLLSLLAGCTTPQSSPSTLATAPSVDPVVDWLAAQEDLAQLSTAESRVLLSELENPRTDTDLYYYALLKQQAGTLDGWTQARTSYATLLKSTTLRPGQRHLVGILQAMNQSRINHYFKTQALIEEKQQLQQVLETAQEEKLLLEQKIQALTDLETVISTRREE